MVTNASMVMKSILTNVLIEICCLSKLLYQVELVCVTTMRSVLSGVKYSFQISIIK